MSAFDLDAVWWVGHTLYGLGLLVSGLACVFLIAAIDDLVLDLTFWGHRLRRWWVGEPWLPHLDPQLLGAEPPKWIAVMVPAWDESAVLAPMLQRLLASASYPRLRVFVGTYPNDPATRETLRHVLAVDPRVTEIVNDRDGPTCKADCLNALWRGIAEDERKYGRYFEIIVMQDCEDLIHPLAWGLYNHRIPRYDMVQLPVLSLPRKWWQWTAAHYQDEFAQLHLKDLIARGLFSGNVPAAGVGVGFNRTALARIAALHDDRPFNTASLAEDYDIALQMRDLGFTQHFALCAAPAGEADDEHLFAPEAGGSRLISVREYFPDRLRAAVRQKSRWVIGIALQAWQGRGWTGPWPMQLMLWRDRKVLLTHPAAALGYLVATLILAQWLWQVFDPTAPSFPPIVPADSITAGLLVINLILLALRMAQRALCVTRVYGPVEGLWSIPRSVWGSLINAWATFRALRLWWRHRWTGQPIGWDKTAHQFPEGPVRSRPSPSLPVSA
ncbi:MAG: hypothetical protein RL322_2076 [Pseudomonadota bacterium]